jgi:hypothetical protein
MCAPLAPSWGKGPRPASLDRNKQLSRIRKGRRPRAQAKRPNFAAHLDREDAAISFWYS